MLINYKHLQNDKYEKFDARLSFFFASTVAPNFILNFTGFFVNQTTQSKKIQLKQTYVLFTWFYYLTFAKSMHKKTINFFVLPKQRTMSTQIKAPIAHKNWSKEQYEFSNFLIRISFNAFFQNRRLPYSINAGLLFALLSKKAFPTFETNTLFLKTFKILFYITDDKFFNYKKFLIKK